MLNAREFLDNQIKSDELPPVGIEDLTEEQILVVSQLMYAYKDYVVDTIHAESFAIIAAYKSLRKKYLETLDLLNQCLETPYFDDPNTFES